MFEKIMGFAETKDFSGLEIRKPTFKEMLAVLLYEAQRVIDVDANEGKSRTLKETVEFRKQFVDERVAEMKATSMIFDFPGCKQRVLVYTKISVFNIDGEVGHNHLHFETCRYNVVDRQEVDHINSDEFDICIL